MANKAVFMDRDNTLIEDPGYLSDPAAVRLLPGVELAIKSLSQAGYKVVVVTNQSGVARGLLTEENLEEIHGELRRQLKEKGAHVDAIHYCPYHPEGTVERYAQDSQLRKPNPGMLLKAAAELGIDLASSWMIGDGARDVEAGQRAGCRTIRVRTRTAPSHQAASPDADENVQADYTVRNLVDAARIILREGGRVPVAKIAAAKAAIAGAAALAAAPPAPATDFATRTPSVDLDAGAAAPEACEVPAPAEGPSDGQVSPHEHRMDDSTVRQEILRHVRQMAVERRSEEFSATKLLAGIVQMLALLALVLTFWRMMQNSIPAATLWAIITVALQVMALTFFTMQRQK